jgi:hypothetical protein
MSLCFASLLLLLLLLVSRPLESEYVYTSGLTIPLLFCCCGVLDAPAGSDVAGACLRAVLPLLRSEVPIHRELLQRALQFVPPPYIEKLFESLHPYDADAAKSRKTGNKKEALRIELLRVYASCACGLKHGFEEREQVLKKFVQVIKDTNAYLVSNESVPCLYSLKHSLFLIVKNVIEWVSNHSAYKRDTFFPISLRSQLFTFIAQFSGNGISAAPVQKREQQDLDDALSKLKTPEERDQLRQTRLQEVCVCTLLSCPLNLSARTAHHTHHHVPLVLPASRMPNRQFCFFRFLAMFSWCWWCSVFACVVFRVGCVYFSSLTTHSSFSLSFLLSLSLSLSLSLHSLVRWSMRASTRCVHC